MIHFKLYTTVQELPSDWDRLVAHDIFLQKAYLRGLDKASPTNIRCYYLGIFADKTLVGVAIIQRVALYLEDIFRNYKDSCYKQKFKHFVSRFLKGNMLVVGNLMHTGQHGFYFDANSISQREFLETVYSGLKEFMVRIKKQNKKHVRIIVFKDYFSEDFIHLENDFFQTRKIHKVSVQPNMILNIRPYWANLDDYASELNKKYRQRYKVARKKAVNISKSELDCVELERECDLIYALYKTVSDNAKINTFILPKDHFLDLKRELGPNFKVFGYYLEGKLIGFYTLILNNKVLETYFLGYDEVHQYSNQLYLNMLYDMLGFAISNTFESIVFARTAMEIKSSIGAKPKEMFLYLKHTNRFMNALLEYIFKLMNPSQEWEERHPFKT